MALAQFRYPAEKLSHARRMLMAPHPQGDAEAYGHAFHECSLGLRGLRDEDFDDSARSWVRTIREAMDTRGINDPSGRGTIFVKAELLSVEEKYQVSGAIDELASWFNHRFWAG